MAEEAEYDVLITTDQNMRRQLNMANRRVAIVVLMDTGWPRIARRTEAVREALVGIRPGEVLPASRGCQTRPSRVATPRLGLMPG